MLLARLFIIKSKSSHKKLGKVINKRRGWSRMSPTPARILPTNTFSSLTCPPPAFFLRRSKALFILEYSRVCGRKSLDCHCGGLIILLSDEGDTTTPPSRDRRPNASTHTTTHGSRFYCPRSNYGVI